MTFKHNLGEFDSLEEVWQRYPSGGQEGDYLDIDGKIYRWNSIVNQWTIPAYVVPETARKTESVLGDLNVENNLSVGGILRARVVRGRSASCGLFVDTAALTRNCPSPLVGQWALIMIENRTDEDGNAIGEVYVCEEDGVWKDAGYRGGFDGEYDALLTEKEERQENDAYLKELIDDEAQAREAADDLEKQQRQAADEAEKKRATSIEQEIREIVNAKEENIYKAMEGLQAGGVVLKQEFGNSPYYGISQKMLTESRDKLQSQIDELKESEAVVGITVNPTLIEVGQTTTLSFNATSDKTATKIEIFAAGELIKSGEDIKTLNGTIGDPFVSGTPGELEVVADFSYNNNHKSDSAIVTSVLPIYYGVGEGYAAANTKAPLKTSPAGIYQVNVPVADKYVYFVIPDSMEIRGAKMGGFDFPLEAPELITRGGKPYKGYRSCNTYNVGVLTIEIL